VSFYGLGRTSARAGGVQGTALAIGGALLIAIAGAIFWGLIALLLHMQLSLISVLIGAGVGAVVARYRPGHMPTIIAGAVLAVGGCALGELAGIVFAYLNANIPPGVTFSHFNLVMREFPHEVGGLGILFWAIAACAAIWVPAHSHRAVATRAPVQPTADDVQHADNS
jgi:hypothetical protein